MPGRPVRLQWMREQEHAWEPFGPAMVTHAQASLDQSGAIVDWTVQRARLVEPVHELHAGRRLAPVWPTGIRAVRWSTRRRTW